MSNDKKEHSGAEYVAVLAAEYEREALSQEGYQSPAGSFCLQIQAKTK